MAKQQMVETNILVPPSAFDALERFAATNHFSRDEALRLILRDHIDEQLTLEEDHRVTHISTVIRHPRPPANRSESSTGRRLRLRLPPGMADEARAVSLLLPGQAPGRAYRDYQPRPLADSVITAIAKVQLFEDDVLNGLLPLIRFRSAHSLWRLTVEGTRTRAELHALLPTDDRGRRIALRLGEDEDEVAWRGPWRDEVMRHLVRRLLSGTGAKDNEDMLFQRSGLRWDDLLVEVRFPADDTDPVVRDWPDEMRNWEGRGGAAVWRASRTVDLEDLRAWITRSRAPRSHPVLTPGWTLEMPTSWRAIVTTRGSVPDRWRAAVDEGEAIEINCGSKVAVWPVLDEHHPVPGFSAVLEAAKGLQPDEIVELTLMCWDEDILSGPLVVPAHRARNLGFIDTGTRDQLITAAREQTRANMSRLLVEHANLAPDVRRTLEDAMDDPSRFTRIARRTGLRTGAVIVSPQWVWWDFESAAHVLAGGASATAVDWVVGAVARRRQRTLEASMEEASRKAFHQAHHERTSGV